MKRLLSAIATFAFASALQAQEPPPMPGMGGGGIAACLDRLADKFGDRMRIPGTGIDRPEEMGGGTRSMFGGMGMGDSASLSLIKMEVADAARQCMAGLTPETADKKDLRSLLSLYTLAEQYDQAYATVKRIASLKPKPRDKAVEMSDGVRLLAPSAPKTAERLMTELDRLGATQAEWRMIGHGVLMDSYIASGVNADRDKHFDKALAAAKQIKTRDSKVAWEIGNIYVSYATALLNAGDKDRSRAIVKRGLTDLAGEEVALRELKLLDESTKE